MHEKISERLMPNAFGFWVKQSGFNQSAYSRMYL
jgi:hypothetical protein